MAARHRTRIPIIRLLYFGIFAACGSLMLLGYNGGDGPPIQNSSPPTPGISVVHGLCVSKNDTLYHRYLRRSGNSSTDVAIITWSFTDYIRGLLGSLAYVGHVTVLCISGGHLCPPSPSAVVTSDCDDERLRLRLLPTGAGAVHFVYDADEHVTMAGMTSSVTGRLFHCHTAVFEELVRKVQFRDTVYFHFVQPTKVYYDVQDKEYNGAGIRPCTVTFDPKDGHQLYIKLLEMILRIYGGLCDLNYYFLV
ncbi:hypothetical protein LSH36_330g11025 [Paralvinella palmiformis]|uniref:Uncharacterized protein n=1 Tax=Paralvinella palmiformis TaxID=53620 RepID=A0AAD9JFV0_9ANNE|nr:hypothetical protein LSH36_330g11025 [Paralvinella palmiformis]